MSDSREIIINRAVKEIEEGMVVNLGIGMPTMIADKIPAEKNIFLHSENGMLGIGNYPIEGEEDADLINAGKETVTAKPGAAFFDNAESFAMIRGGHVDLTILGGMEVSQTGDLANWMIPGKMVKGMGGAMDIVQGARKVVIIMTHTNKAGEAKIKKQCDLPLTGQGVVNRVITDMAVFDFTNEGMVLREALNGHSIESIKENTDADFTIDPSLSGGQ
ncbi:MULTISPECIES: 3-oxoacid CoA-transferase subunit B [unclassified Geomicrobium]|uniref:3-oxoacid CoA-transferase subunit B n=1 Tax=unclassified Geomicrobium TaxID=2628951 RepID=UPI00045ED7F1|nr:MULTISPECIES: 3-oxoacid CoA-transferase subunit B [unclassified Geomicrobium]GAJ98836.1 succinyl-CoA:3-ketoacid-coenzyme A transferase subunit B [Geomicrobium sp. JCM 19055]GAK07818.1 succinyl-CoA:3-ketoacid-coenzyme A transferase subunit B [Geomicrobium sp. JCM 19038]